MYAPTQICRTTTQICNIYIVVLIVPLMIVLHQGHFLIFSKQFLQVTKCPHGTNVMPTFSSKQICTCTNLAILRFVSVFIWDCLLQRILNMSLKMKNCKNTHKTVLLIDSCMLVSVGELMGIYVVYF